jgi:competence protein ComEC
VEIVEMVEEKANTWKAIAEVKEVIKNDTIYSSHGKILLYVDKKAERKPELGEKYWLINHLQKIEAPKNPYEFDFRRYMELQEIFDQQYVRKGDFVYAGETEHKSIYYYAMLLNRYADRAVIKVYSQEIGLWSGQCYGLGCKRRVGFAFNASLFGGRCYTCTFGVGNARWYYLSSADYFIRLY